MKTGTPIKVLQMNAGSKNFGGVSAMVLNIYRNIDRLEVQFDFLTPNITTYEPYREEIEAMGGHIYQFGINSSTLAGKVRLIKALKDFLGEHPYDIIHINSGVLLFNCVVSGTCKKYSNARIFVHSHNNGGRAKMKELFSALLKGYLSSHTDVALACSKDAAYYMFPEKRVSTAHIINNGIDTSKFRYDGTVRENIRTELGINHKYVVGHVGRFMPQKNHELLIDIFEEVSKENDRAVLMLLGQGELEEQIKEKVKRKGLSEKVLFLGQRTDAAKYYNAMDVFVLPSLFEGYPVTVVEAQASGLRCVVSEATPEEANITGDLVRIPLNTSVMEWAQCLKETAYDRRSKEEIVKQQYDIKKTAAQMMELYAEESNVLGD